LRTCQGLLAALRKAGIPELGPQVVGDYFPGRTPQQLARKKDLCAGAAPQLHSHFFTAAGAFGSLDQTGQQVDDGVYRTQGNRLILGAPGDNQETWQYAIAGGRLTLTPIIPAPLIRQAHAHPLEPNGAGHLVAVAYTGHVWKQVDCASWC
jgi:hypothetical protein